MPYMDKSAYDRCCTWREFNHARTNAMAPRDYYGNLAWSNYYLSRPTGFMRADALYHKPVKPPCCV